MFIQMARGGRPLKVRKIAGLEAVDEAVGRATEMGRSCLYIPGILDIPDKVQSVILENPDPGGPWGVRGMAEMPFIPLTPAVTAAIHDAIGVWYDEFPLTPERVLWGIQASASD